MALKAKKPEEMSKRFKMFLYGEAGSGKTTASIQLPRPYIIDTEKGTEQRAYVKLIAANGGAVLQTANSDNVIAELKSLLTEKHDFRTLVIDPITNIEDDVIQSASIKYKADEKEGGDMRVWRDRDKTMRRITSLVLSLDMNVVVTAHGKINYGDNFTKLGTTYDGWKKWPFLFDLVLELVKIGGKRIAKVKKTRMEEFPDGEEFEWNYAELAKRLGADNLEREAKPVVLATTEQVAEIKNLVDTVKLPEGTVEKWLDKAGVEDFNDMPAEIIVKCIAFVQKRLEKGSAA
jgi:hypothetical protein